MDKPSVEGSYLPLLNSPYTKIQIANPKDELGPNIELLGHQIVPDQDRIGLTGATNHGTRGMCAGQKDVLQRHLADVLDMGHPVGLDLEAVHGEQLSAIVAGHIMGQALARGVLGNRLIAVILPIPATREVKFTQFYGRYHLTCAIG